MAELDIAFIGDAVLQKVKEQEISIPELAKAAEVDYNTVKSFLSGKTIPKLDTLQKILKAVGYGFLEILEDDRNVVYLDDEDDMDIRRYRRLNAYYKGLVKTNVESYLALQEKDRKAGRDRSKE
ncbi:MAG: helix-turn-helix transcriptional regulator [Lachnospiraceae bacterium]|jgi:transcriptional regulator with XRE-family HTH domain|nr:helix-turn-helix transcriptional regulator [Lachnospiraceae bacterium]